MTNARAAVTQKLRRARLFFAAAAVLIGGGSALIPLLSASSAGAIIGSQYVCSTPSLTITPSSYTPVGPPVHINDGTAKSSNVELTISADADVSNNAEMRNSWSIDGATPFDYQYGPGNLAENQQFFGARTVVDVVGGLGPGVHTIQPEVRLSGGSGTTGVVAELCVLAQRSSN